MTDAEIKALLKEAKNPDEARDLAVRLEETAAAASSEGDHKTAERLLKGAASAARKAKDAAGARRLAGSAKEAELFAEEAEAVAAAERKLAAGKDPKAASVFGFHLLFVRGEVDRGLNFLLEGSRRDLKALAKAELAGPQDAKGMAALGAGWKKVAAREKIRKDIVQKRAEHWLSTAARMGGAPTGKQAKKGGVVDLLAIVDPNQALSGKWTRDGKALITPDSVHSRLPIPVELPAEFDLVAKAARLRGENVLYFGLVGNGHQFMAFFDGGPTSDMAGVDNVGPSRAENPTLVRRRTFPDGAVRTLRLSVRRGRFTVHVDGEKVVSWENPDYGSAKPAERASVPGAPTLYVGSSLSSYRIEVLRVEAPDPS